MVKSMNELAKMAGNEGPGEHVIKTSIGDITVKVSDGGRKTYYQAGKYTKIADLKAQFANPPEAPPQEEEAGENPTTPNTNESLDGLLDRKYKRKKVLKALDKWTGLKPKKKVMVIASIEKLAPKKMTGQEILAAIHAVKDNVKSAKLADLFDLLTK